MDYGDAVKTLQEKGSTIQWGDDLGGDELTAVVRPHDGGRAMGCKEVGEDGLHSACRDGVGPVDGQRHPRELVDHREHLDRAARGDGVVDEVVGPDVVAVGSGDRHAGTGAYLAPSATVAYGQAVLAPDTLDALAVHGQAATTQLRGLRRRISEIAASSSPSFLALAW